MKVLVAEDDPSTRVLLELYARGEPYALQFSVDGADALEKVRAGDVDVLVTDVRMPGLAGDALLKTVKQERPDLPVVLMTAHSSVEDVVQMMKLGADDYIAKPFTREVFVHRIRKVLEQVEKRRENDALRVRLHALEVAPQEHAAHNIVGRSPQLHALLQRLPLVAKTEAPVMILGESGTGKELVAGAIHAQSRRARGKLVAVNCGALPDTLLESELFGYKRGAFTDAHRDTPGLVEAAQGGTLFLDEIGDVSLPVQVKLLRFLQTREYKPLGSPQTLKADVRIISATHRDLPALIRDGRFREDLYYRLNIVPLELPPLRARQGDVPLLAHHFLRRFNAEHGKALEGFTPDALRFLESHAWPGNVRELENRVHQAVVLCTGRRVDVADLGVLQARPAGAVAHTVNPVDPAQGILPGVTVDGAGASATFKEAKQRVVAAFEKEFVEGALRRAGGNISVAARASGLDRKNFFLLLRKHRIDPASHGSRVGRPPARDPAHDIH